ESTARSFADRLAHLLGLLVAAPDRPVREAEVLLPEESAAVRAGWAATTVDEPCTGVVERVRAHAAAHPDRIAVQDPDGSATYTELDRKSTRLNSSHVKISYAVFCLKKKSKRNK